MVKKSKIIAKAQKAAATAKPKAENPFDKFANARKKHEVLNRRVKGEDRDVGRARAKAIDERKQKLLKELQQSKRSNVVVDRRFGENDPTMSLEEKMFLRFQKERSKKARNSSVYNLDDEGANEEDLYRGASRRPKAQEILTHKGQVLGESNAKDHDWISSDDEEDAGKLDRDVVNSMHFGGGLVEKKFDPSSALVDAMDTRKGRLDALQEIVMKSKMYKMQRKEAKEDQEQERERLDEVFNDLFKSKEIEMDMKYNRSRRDDRAGEEDAGADEYDKMMAEMMFEAKVQPSDRTKTDEEIALAERERLEELEKARLKRMRAIGDEKMSSRLSAAKKRVKNDDELDDFDYSMNRATPKQTEPEEEDEEEEEEDEDEDGEDDDDDEDEDDQEGEEDEDAEDDEDVDEDEDEDDEEEDDDEGDGDEEGEEDEVPEKSKGKNNKKRERGSDDEEEDEEEEEEVELQVHGFRHRRHKPIVLDEARIEMPHKIDCPSDGEAFDALLQRYVRNEGDAMELINRIAKWNNVHLPGEEGKQNKKHMHNFLDILLKHFVRLGDSLAEEDSSKQLDHLTGVIFQICQDLQDSARQLWSRTLKIAYAQLQKNMRDYAQGTKESCWPSLGKLLLFQLLGHVFSVSDLKNDVVFPASVFLCQCLVQCPVTTVRDLVSGLLVCSILLEYNVDTDKFLPEVNAFVASVLHVFFPVVSSTVTPVYHHCLSTFKLKNLAFLREKLSQLSSVDPTAASRIPWKAFLANGSRLDHLEDCLENISCAVVSAVYRLADIGIVNKFSTESAVRELVLPLDDVLSLVRPHDKPKFPKALQKEHLRILESIKSTVAKCVAERESLQWRKTVKTVIESKAPKFDPHYTMKKDHDEDKTRATYKQLQRQLKREKKATMRELRRDSAFLSEAQFKEKQAQSEARRAERNKNFAWLEDQQATINEQVKKGKDLLKGGGSSAGKKARVKRL